MACYCYILECRNGAYYTGWTTDPLRRFQQHLKGTGASYTRINQPQELVYVEECADRTAAMQRELSLKRLTHAQKKTLIADSTANMLPLLRRQSEAGTRCFTVLAPGRVNLLGEHVDYNGGVVMPVAIDRSMILKVTALTEPLLRLHALDLHENIEVSLDHLEKGLDSAGKPLPGFALYPVGVARALQQAGFSTPGMEVSFHADIPIGAGLSSSAALQTGFAMAWNHLANLHLSPEELATLCHRAENDYVGVKSGIMDQFACCLGQAGQVLVLDTRSLQWQTQTLPPKTVLVIADSGVRRALSNSAYNQRRAECDEALRFLQERGEGIGSFRDISPSFLDAQLKEMPPIPARRAQHVVAEMARVEQARAALLAGDAEAFGQLMNASHTSLQNLFEVSCFELDTLAHLAWTLPGCYGARLTGAGFGGCTVNLVQEDLVEPFMESLRAYYRRLCGREAQTFACRAADGVHVVKA